MWGKTQDRPLKSDFVSESDHDKYERDYYDRESQKHLKGCLESIKVFGVMVILLILCLLFFLGCKSIKEPPVAVPYGPVISIQGDWVEVSFEVINKDPGSQIAGWFYCPLHRYEKGNIFPDFTKYKHPY